uniref:Nucelotide kinase n=1 Tax=Klebsiella phage KpTRp1 TaxID=3236632 RepID=A0AB39AIW0_9CAUD
MLTSPSEYAIVIIVKHIIHIFHRRYNMTDMVNHPSHYTQGSIECIDAIKAATVGKTGIEAVCVANVVKYLWRYEEKNGLEDVKKARWYLERLVNELENK